VIKSYVNMINYYIQDSSERQVSRDIANITIMGASPILTSKTTVEISAKSMFSRREADRCQRLTSGLAQAGV